MPINKVIEILYFAERELVQLLTLTGKITRVSVAEGELVQYFSRTVTITRVNHAERERERERESWFNTRL
jgi:hypothetical protein